MSKEEKDNEPIFSYANIEAEFRGCINAKMDIISGNIERILEIVVKERSSITSDIYWKVGIISSGIASLISIIASLFIK